MLRKRTTILIVFLLPVGIFVILGTVGLLGRYGPFQESIAKNTTIGLILGLIAIFAILVWALSVLSCFASYATIFFIQGMGVVPFVKATGYPTKHLIWKELRQQIANSISEKFTISEGES
jgi:hypothetical protein